MAASPLLADALKQIAADVDSLFDTLLPVPSDPRARFYLALAEAEAGRIDEAVAAWKQLLADAPPDASWRTLAGYPDMASSSPVLNG